MLCFKLTKKFAKKLHTELGKTPDCNAASIWLANEFIWRRTRYIIVMHELSLFTVIFYGKGVNDDNALLQYSLQQIAMCAKSLDVEGCFERFVAHEAGQIAFAMTDSRAVIGSMNQQAKDAKVLFDIREMSPDEASENLNHTPMSLLHGDLPIDAFKRLSGFKLIHDSKLF